MDGWSRRGARDRVAAGVGFVGPARRRGNRPVGRPHPARGGLCHDRRARVLHVGIGRSSEVDRYLAGVNHTVISDFFGNKVQAVGGGTPRSAPGTQHFWVASSTGPGARTLKWDPHGGSWTVVVMNANAQPGIGVRADLGARMPAVLWIAIGLLIAGAVFLAGGGLVIAGAIRGRRASADAGAGASADVGAGPDSTAAAATTSSITANDEGRSHAEH